MNGTFYFIEDDSPDLARRYQIRRVLHQERSPFQEIAVVEHGTFGRMLLLDGIVQTSLADEFIYHEMLAHVAMCAHPDPRKVLVIGGGDGGVVREVLRHPGIEEVHLVEIDERVTEVCLDHLPEIASGLADRRVKRFAADGAAHIAERKQAYDVILVDAPDPVGPAVTLFQKEFYQNARQALTGEGIFAAQTDSPFFRPDFVRETLRSVQQAFPLARLYLAHVPTYSPGPWSFTIGSLALDPAEEFRRPELPGLRYYTASAHEAAFRLPPYIRQSLKL